MPREAAQGMGHNAILQVLPTGRDDPFGIPSSQPRFETQDDTVLDRLTGLVWTRNANPFDFPLTWREALRAVADMNAVRLQGRADWRLPNRRELRSLIEHSRRLPALPQDHPFTNVFLAWRWTSTTAAIDTAYAWSVHLEGGRMFYGSKKQGYLAWPVCGDSLVIPRTRPKVLLRRERSTYGVRRKRTGWGTGPGKGLARSPL